MKKTFKELGQIDNMVGKLYKKHEKLERTKFGYAYKRFADKNFYPNVEKYQQELGMIRIDNAMEDKETKEVMVDRTNQRGFKYTKEGLKNCIKAEIKLNNEWDEKEIDIEPYMSIMIPNEMSDEEVEMLIGLVFNFEKKNETAKASGKVR